MSEIDELSRQLGEACLAAKVTLVTAESCTGGGVGEAITRTAGSSAWFDRGFVTYSNDAKVDLLGVKQETIGSHGAVSEAVAREMARGRPAPEQRRHRRRGDRRGRARRRHRRQARGPRLVRLGDPRRGRCGRSSRSSAATGRPSASRPCAEALKGLVELAGG